MISVYEFMTLKQIITRIYYNFNKKDLTQYNVHNAKDRLFIYELARIQLLFILNDFDNKELSMKYFGKTPTNLIKYIIFYWEKVKKGEGGKFMQTNYAPDRMKYTIKEYLTMEVEEPNKLLRKFQIIDNDCTTNGKNCIIGYPVDYDESMKELVDSAVEYEELPWFTYNFEKFSQIIGNMERNPQNHVIRISCDGAIAKALVKNRAIVKESEKYIVGTCGVNPPNFISKLAKGEVLSKKEKRWNYEYKRLYIIPPIVPPIKQKSQITSSSKKSLDTLNMEKKDDEKKSSVSKLPPIAGGKKCRKHKGIVQSGGNKGKLKKGYKYTGKRTKTGLSIITKV